MNQSIKQPSITIFTIGLAIFTMLFGAGNVIYPIKAGLISAQDNWFGIIGFLLTGVMLPIIGLVAMILFDGDYKKFFYRIGKVPGSIAILYCMLIIGPLLVMPRCITVPYDLILPFLPSFLTLPLFSFLFALTTFIFAYKESKLLDILGKYMSPILIGSLGLIIVLGLFQAQNMQEQHLSFTKLFVYQLIQGFKTLDLIGSLFFAYVILRLLKLNAQETHTSSKELALLALKGGGVAAMFLTAFYVGFSFLGAFYGHLVTVDMNGAEIFRIISLHVVKSGGIAILCISVLMACISTITALAAVFAEYVRNEIFHKKISYTWCLALGLLVTTIISNFGLSNILKYSDPFIEIGYPIIISIVFCNLAYSLFNFQWIKLPVFITTVIVTILYFY